MLTHVRVTDPPLPLRTSTLRLRDEKWYTSSANVTLTDSTTTQGGSLNEVQRVGWTASDSMSGTFTLTYSGQTTSAISASATAAQVASALEALSNIGTGDVQVELLETPYGTGDRIYRVTFQGALAATNVAQISIDVSNITGGYYSSPSAVQATDVVGGVYSEVQQITLSNSSGGTWRLAYNGEVTAPLAHNANAAAVESALESLGGIDQVTVTGSSGSFTVTFAGSHANLPMEQIFGDAANATNGTTVRTISNEYNAASELVSISDPSSTIEYTRDNLGRATSIENVIAGLTPVVVLVQAFDAASNRTELSATIGSTADFKNTYSYDSVNRLIDIVQQSQSGGNAVTAKHVKISYNGNHQQALIERFQSTGTSSSVAASTFTYDSLNRLSLLEHEQGSTVLSTYDYAYDGLSRFTSIDSSIEGLSSFEYDASGQLTDADHASQTDEAYTYNANGSRSMTGYTTSTNNRTTAMPGFTFSYDDEGNRTRKTQTSNGHVQDYEWDHRNRLTSVKFRNSVGGSITKQVDYEYDACNRLVKRTYDADGAGGGSATNQYWVYDEGINAVLQFDGNAASNLSHRYLWSDKVDQLLADEQVTSLGSGGNVLWALSDHLGTIRDIADFDESTGITAIANHRKYTAFGALISETNNAVDLNYGFTGKQLDEATHLQHNLNRWYDSALGQWLSEDPIGFDAGDENLRRYVRNSGTRLIDPQGLQEQVYQGTLSEKDKAKYKATQERLQKLVDESDLSRLKALESEDYKNAKTDSDTRFYIFDDKYYKDTDGNIIRIQQDEGYEGNGFDSQNYAQSQIFYLDYHLDDSYSLKYVFNEEIYHGIVQIQYENVVFYVDPMYGVVSMPYAKDDKRAPTEYYNGTEPPSNIKNYRPWEDIKLDPSDYFSNNEKISKMYLEALKQAGVTEYKAYFPPNYQPPQDLAPYFP